jgi:hypothetical protein
MKKLTRMIALLMVLLILGGCSEEKKESGDVLEILMIGDERVLHFAQELYDVADAAGVQLRVCSAYCSDSALEDYWTWWKCDEQAYEFYTTDVGGEHRQESLDLQTCLAQGDWDVISIQGVEEAVYKARTAQEAAESTREYWSEIYEYLKTQCPNARLAWHETWAYEVGYDDGVRVMESLEQQTAYSEKMHAFAELVCREQGVTSIPSGDAWQIIREGNYDSLCARLAAANGTDYNSDGDVGGGQLLNAYVWFEVITGESCVGNTYRPTYTRDGVGYTLDEELVLNLQNAAHRAVNDLPVVDSEN